jgi:hypothetical protein
MAVNYFFIVFFQTEGYKELCHCVDESPNLTFRFQHVAPRPERISCKFKVCQDNCKSDNPVNISVSLHFESEVIDLHSIIS